MVFITRILELNLLHPDPPYISSMRQVSFTASLRKKLLSCRMNTGSSNYGKNTYPQGLLIG